MSKFHSALFLVWLAKFHSAPFSSTTDIVYMLIFMFYSFVRLKIWVNPYPIFLYASDDWNFNSGNWSFRTIRLTSKNHIVYLIFSWLGVLEHERQCEQYQYVIMRRIVDFLKAIREISSYDHLRRIILCVCAHVSAYQGFKKTAPWLLVFIVKCQAAKFWLGGCLGRTLPS